ncbi:MAG: hypothetical protein CVU15_07775 [Betaproteobacteria bacterium HGW-Betaproteobacteria-1]|jgi:hypothetical protein|nr:MAG: hypothetical protein CVU15_07775 [Betaproteobacteria bacterium HGW-Betaproteobacteria-1]
MARHYTVYLNRDRFPKRAGLQAAIKALGFKLTLEEDYVPFISSGYLPCTLNGEDAGFTLRFHTTDGINGRDGAATLQWSGDPREQASAIMVAAALAHEFGALVHDADGRESSIEAMLAEAEKIFAELN